MRGRSTVKPAARTIASWPAFIYYLDLGARGLRHNAVLTALMILAVGMGVGASMTVLTALRNLSADPIPAKAHQLSRVRIDNWGPSTQ